MYIPGPIPSISVLRAYIERIREPGNKAIIPLYDVLLLALAVPHMQRNGQGLLKSKQEGEYDGSWENDLRHGFGKQKYPNGDYYEGGWELNKVRGQQKNQMVP